MSKEADIIRAKDWVILKRGAHLQLYQLGNKPRLHTANAQFDLRPILGKPYWSTFRVELLSKNRYGLVYCDPNESIGCILENETSGTDNRHIQDDNNAQLLTKDEILNMKNSGVSSQEILQELVKNSKTFLHKTEFAQEKWLQKKCKKYTDYMQILKPTIRLLSEVLLKPIASSKKLLGLRVDTLSQIVTAVNLHPEGKYIIYENNCEGLVVASILNLLNSKGKLLNIVTPNYSFSKRRAFSAMKFLDEKRSRLVNIRLSSFTKYLNMDGNQTNLQKNPMRNEVDSLSEDAKLLHEASIVGSKLTDDINGEFSNELPTDDKNLKRKAECSDFSPRKRTTQQEIDDQEISNLITSKADGLILICKEIPNKLLTEMLVFLAPSRSFVVYYQFQEPLVKLYMELKQRHDIIYLRLFENFLRPYQILPDRTHPTITMSGTGGYLLTGVVVTNLTCDTI